VAQGDGRWEGEVRRLFADRAERLRHPGTDLAGTAISRARRVRRRRSVIGLAMIVAGTLVASGAALHDWRGTGDGPEFGVVSGLLEEQASQSPTPDPAPGLVIDDSIPAELSADVIGEATDGGLVLVTAGGERLELGSIRHVISAHRLSEGWAVVSGDPGTARLWWVAPGREPTALLAGMDTIVVDHGQVAWQRGVMLSAATLSPDGRLEGRVSTRAPQGDGYPVGFVQEAVLLERTETNGWDTWHPARGDYEPTWNDEVIRVYGSVTAGPPAVGLVPPQQGSDGPCLARLDAELEVSGVSCVPEALSADAPGAVSPQGKWLLNGLMLVDLVEAFGGREDQAVTDVAGAPSTVTMPVWLGPDRVLFAAGDSLVQVWPERLRTGAADAVEQFPLYGASSQVVQPV
jgi:hypothetical protein